MRTNARTIRAVLALGANLGNRRASLQSAVDDLAGTDGVTVVAASSVVETAPVGGPAQPDYLNAVVLVDTTLSPHELLAACQRIENAHGRVRQVRWGPRTLDIDLIAHGDARLAAADLALPHPRAAQRAFVLVPWLDVDPDATLPDPRGMHRPVGDLLALLADDQHGVRRCPGGPLEVPA